MGTVHLKADKLSASKPTEPMLRVRLNDVLQRRGMSQRELARRTDKHPDVISRFAREATEMVSYDLLDCICGALSCGVADLLEYVPDPGEQIGLFEAEDDADGNQTYPRTRIVMKAAENRPAYGAAGRTSGGPS